jgi:hypothetical protein
MGLLSTVTGPNGGPRCWRRSSTAREEYVFVLKAKYQRADPNIMITIATASRRSGGRDTSELDEPEVNLRRRRRPCPGERSH